MKQPLAHSRGTGLDSRVMDINDYLIDHQSLDWARLLSDWDWLLPAEYNVWLMNRFGDLVLIADEEAIFFFDVGNGTIERIADNKVEFSQKLDVDDNANIWLMIPLIDQLNAMGKKNEKTDTVFRFRDRATTRFQRIDERAKP